MKPKIEIIVVESYNREERRHTYKIWIDGLDIRIVKCDRFGKVSYSGSIDREAWPTVIEAVAELLETK